MQHDTEWANQQNIQLILDINLAPFTSSCDCSTWERKMFDMYKKHSTLLSKKIGLFALFCLVLIACVGFSSTVLAKGDGIKIGQKGRFHPRLFMNFGFDSNVLQRSSRTDSSSPFAAIESAPYFSVRPGLELKVDTKSVGFLLAGFANYTQFIPLTSSSIVGRLSNIAAKADLQVQLFRDKPVSITIANNFSRSTGDTQSASDVFARTVYFYQPGSQNGAVFISHNNSTSLGLTFKPGGGALTFDLGYSFSFGLYPSSDLDSNTHGIRGGMKWSFFPRTAFTFDAQFNITNYNPGLDFGKKSTVNNGGKPLKVAVGIIGQLTEKLLLTFRLGGGYTFSDTTANTALNDNWGMVIGNLDLTYKIQLTTFIRAGLRHDFNPSPFSNFYHETVAYVEFGSQFGPIVRPLVFNIRVDGGFIGYGKITPSLGSGQFISQNPNPDGSFNRRDFMVRASTNLDWHVFKFWMIGLLARFQYQDSDLFIVQGGNRVGLGFTKFEVMFNTELAF